jgi:hypothetical protein
MAEDMIDMMRIVPLYGELRSGEDIFHPRSDGKKDGPDYENLSPRDEQEGDEKNMRIAAKAPDVYQQHGKHYRKRKRAADADESNYPKRRTRHAESQPERPHDCDE